MKKLIAIGCYSFALTTTNSAFSGPIINAVIGLDNSQITELNQGISLIPNKASILPLEEAFSPISFMQNDANANWINSIGNKVKVEHKLRDLNYTGTLSKIESNAFLLKVNNKPILLPLDDFYLIPLENQTSGKNNQQQYPAKLSYQSNQLSWTPQLSLIVANGKIIIHQNALLHNRSDTSIELKNSLLHYSRSQPTLFKAERTSMALQSSVRPIEYQNNEATYSLESITLAPHTDTLYPLKNTRSKIEQSVHTASLFTRNNNRNNRGKIDLNFQSMMKFTFTEEGLPGEYQLYWQRDNLLIPGNKTYFNTVRAKQTASISSNKSLDLTGNITLVSASSPKLPTTQIWEAKIRNNSNQTQSFSIEQSVEGILESVAGDGVSQSSANTLMLTGQIKSHSTKVIQYTLKLKK
ncbi:hypothetical protein [Marinomonas transparens]|uniref:DUF4139 domain-containing protein n=1 Tax=Marinomonas transparens TaxID=2795388 RepID=A0A934MWT2_9GAMM|nr:hypothetical protein [Marinomonas transparens]MBJ7538524.1 hypothetical protein [Marinomonas transparens]